ncbi:hypothetical protein SJS73_06600 [Aeromonas caviae]|uniref:DUF6896 domain-containing protein n=1 Tax=Aeromonas caviae TaxID=648 RepID=UPI001C1F7DDE|nr:hypothetical protein [Aeromonas caviae]MCX4048659.1 hypothetical protein [Aeromonas caviae]MCX4108243.1 hypothetical protein [Aeromonas caviae]MDX7724770.1 hypothetical protein [Aeromonas caviae]
MDNLEKIKNLIPLWYAQRKWAEELLVRVFHLASAEEILEPKHRGSMTIPGTHWVYRTHGVGVDIYRTASVGGIDFDFNKPDPDEWRLKIFFEKQYNEGNLSYSPRTASSMRMKNCLTAL